MGDGERKQLMKVMEDSWGLDHRHSQEVKRIKKQVDKEIDDQQGEEKRNGKLVDEVSDL
jgi:hypothetical protein